jgi:LmbE family N-acetylglucosaminyl deacetylase
MPTATTVVLSPHPDDAVLSCWHVLAGEPGVRVVNVFTAIPTTNSVYPWWDRMTGATDSAQRMRERLEEDRDALALAGAAPVNLDFLDEQYRDRKVPSESIAEAVAAQVEPGSRIYVPGGIGKTLDHALVRGAGTSLHRRGYPVSVYADLPHAVEFGWPGFVTGKQIELDPEPFWTFNLREATGDSEPPAPEVHRLSPEDQRRKLEAVRAYATQYPALEMLFERVEESERMAYEVTWTLPEAS